MDKNGIEKRIAFVTNLRKNDMELIDKLRKEVDNATTRIVQNEGRILELQSMLTPDPAVKPPIKKDFKKTPKKKTGKKKK